MCIRDRHDYFPSFNQSDIFWRCRSRTIVFSTFSKSQRWSAVAVVVTWFDIASNFRFNLITSQKVASSQVPHKKIHSQQNFKKLFFPSIFPLPSQFIQTAHTSLKVSPLFRHECGASPLVCHARANCICTAKTKVTVALRTFASCNAEKARARMRAVAINALSYARAIGNHLLSLGTVRLSYQAPVVQTKGG